MDLTPYLPQISSVAGTILMIALLAFLLPRYFAEALAPKTRLAKILTVRPAAGQTRRHASESAWKTLLYVLIVFAASRAALFAGTALFAKATGRWDAYSSNLYGFWVKWDAPHYLGLIRDWYVNEGDPMYHIVFFPVYPLVCRLLLPLFGGNASASAFTVSNVCAVAAGYFLCALVRRDGGDRDAKRAVRYFFLNPLSFFLSLPYTESLFLLLTLLAVYLARKRRFLPAICVGALCSASRLMGALIAIPIFYEMLVDLRKRGGLNAKAAIAKGLLCCGVLTGVAAYLYLNWRVTGNPFQFWIYQRDHWFNTRGTLRNTFHYVVLYALSANANLRLGTWIPTVAALYGAIALLIANARKARAGDAAYGWAYLYMTIVPTWLISGPRYVSGMYPIYPMLARAGRRRWLDIAISCAFGIAGVYMACLFVFFSSVY